MATRTASHYQGFTLVELLIVVVVVALLAAISVFAYVGFRDRATNAAVVQELSQWESAIKAYLTTNGSYPVPDYPVTNSASAVGAVCLSSNNSGTNYCDLMSGQSTAGGYNNTTKDAISNSYASQMTAAGISIPTRAGSSFTIQLGTVSGDKKIRGILYKYSFYGSVSSQDYGVFLVYPLKGSSCAISSDIEVDPIQYNSNTSNAYWGTTGGIVCRRLLSKSLQ